MSLYAQTLRTYSPGSGSGNPFFDIKSCATSKVSVIEIIGTVPSGLSGGGTPMSCHMQRSPTVLVQLDPRAFISEELEQPSETKVATAWSVIPTVGTINLRRHQFLPNPGCGFVWAFPRGLFIDSDRSLVFWPGGNQPMYIDFSIQIDE